MTRHLSAFEPPQPIPYELSLDPILLNALDQHNKPGTRWSLISTTSHTVITNGEIIAKAYNYHYDRLIAENEMNNLMGINSEIITSKNGEKILVMSHQGEAITSIDLSGVVKTGNLLLKIHNTNPPKSHSFVHVDPYTVIEDLIESLLSTPDPEHTGTPEWLARQCCKYQGLLSTIPTNQDVLLHGDAHLFNIVENKWGHLHYIDYEKAGLGHPVLDYGAVFQSLMVDHAQWGIEPRLALPMLGFDHGATDELRGGIIYNILLSVAYHYIRYGNAAFHSIMKPKYMEAEKFLHEL